MADFSEIQKYLKRIEHFIQHEVPEIIGTEAVNHFTENFDNQSFDGKSWQDVKRRKSSSTWLGFEYGAKTRKPANHPSRRGTTRAYKKRRNNPVTNYSPTAKKRPILSSKRSNLENSIRYKIRGNRITIFSDVPYASVHNDGGEIKVFGKHKATVPQRQFIGQSKILENKIVNKLNQKINNLR